MPLRCCGGRAPAHGAPPRPRSALAACATVRSSVARASASLECPLFLGFFERGRRGGQLPCERVTLAGDLRKARRDRPRRERRDAPHRRRLSDSWRASACWMAVCRLSSCSSAAARDVAAAASVTSNSASRSASRCCRRSRVGRPVRPGLLERHSRVAQLPFECLARRRSLRHGLFERCPGVRLFQCSLFPGCFERGRRGTQLPCQRITLTGDLREVRSSLRVVRGATFRIGGALRCMPRLGLLGGQLEGSRVCCSAAARDVAAAASVRLELRFVLLESLPPLQPRRPRGALACSSAAAASLT